MEIKQPAVWSYAMLAIKFTFGIPQLNNIFIAGNVQQSQFMLWTSSLMYL